MAWMNQFSTSNGTTDVTILAAPAASTSRMIPAGGIIISNLDTVKINVTLQIHDTAPSDHVLYPDIEILPNGVWTNQKSIHVLNTSAQTLEIFLAAAITTSQAQIAVTYRDEAQ